jgi:indole-3-glycerol phosphate synthase
LPATYLDTILAAHRKAAAADGRSTHELVAAAHAASAPRGFRQALVDASSDGHLAVIAEVKRRSPSRGDLAPGLDPALLAGQYVAGGAAALSILTDVEFFGGSPHDLASARAAITVPVLRKDFTIDEHDVCDARIMGADAVLLIAAALSDTELGALRNLAVHLGLDVLVEVHDEPELERAVAVGADLIGVNQRDLVTFAVDTDRAVRMAPLMPAGVVRVAESGVRGPTDAQRLAAAGYHAVLVGESLVTSDDPAAGVAALRVDASGAR